MFLGPTITQTEAALAFKALEHDQLLVMVRSQMDEVLKDMINEGDVDECLSPQDQANMAIHKCKASVGQPKFKQKPRLKHKNVFSRF